MEASRAGFEYGSVADDTQGVERIQPEHDRCSGDEAQFTVEGGWQSGSRAAPWGRNVLAIGLRLSGRLNRRALAAAAEQLFVKDAGCAPQEGLEFLLVEERGSHDLSLPEICARAALDGISNVEGPCVVGRLICIGSDHHLLALHLHNCVLNRADTVVGDLAGLYATHSLGHAAHLSSGERAGESNDHRRKSAAARGAVSDSVQWAISGLTLVETLFEPTARGIASPHRCETIHQHFEAQARRTPEAIAVSMEGQELTFAELDAKSNRLARYLRRRQVGPDMLVGLCVERSLDLLVGLLGILKSGGAYVPLDPTYPTERLQYLMEDSSPAVLVTQERLASRFPANSSTVVCLDAHWSDIATEDCASLELAQNVSGMLAYVIYTSGSTGQPKGVMVEHAQVLNHWRALESLYRHPCDCRRIALNAPVTFDASVQQIVQLLSGCTVYPIPQGLRLDPRRLLRFLVDNKIEGIDCTPSQLSTWVAAGLLDLQLYPRTVLVGGEAIDPALWRRLSECAPITFYNVYGPTECTVDSTVARISLANPTPNIGRPMLNTTVHILGPDGRAVSEGAVGELFIGGAGVARGYWRRPELTAERFLPDPFRGGMNDRLYRTGDVARWGADGHIEYLGRNDDQVKIRGHRIELGEIEAQLLSHDDVKEAVVVARDDGAGKCLVGYALVDSADLKARRQARLEADRAQMVDQWQELYEQTYSAAEIQPTFLGWNSSYTGDPIAEDQMREWQAQTVARIRELNPRAVLEIGCGVGLIVEPLAAHCGRYLATDFSAQAVRRLGAWLKTQQSLQHVQLLRAAAHELPEFEPASFDTIVLNSVVQYFPDIEYLHALLKRAARWVTPGGHIFIGDVRHLGVLGLFHESVQLHKGTDSMSAEALKRRVAVAIELDKELVVDGSFFEEVCAAIPEVSAVKTLLKRGRSDNELTRYRYDVVLKIGPLAPVVPAERVEWCATSASLDAALAGMSQSQGRRVRLCNVRNRRLVPDALVASLLQTAEDSCRVAELRAAARDASVVSLDPEDVFAFAEAHGIDARVSWSKGSTEGHFDVEFGGLDCGNSEAHQRSSNGRTEYPGSLARYATDPWARTLQRELAATLREYLAQKLPPFMVPSAVVVLERWPLSPSGKLDRRALPAPLAKIRSPEQYEAPQGEAEEQLAAIWQSLLRVEDIGRHDNFFELGGHSLLIVQMLERLRHVGLTTEVRRVFESPTLADLASTLAGFKDQVEVPPNQIPSGCSQIAPSMLPLVQLDREHIARIVRQVPGGARNIQDIYPLAPLQEGLLFHHLMNGREGDPYVVPTLLALESAKRLQDFVSAIEAVIARHDVLRTAVLWDGLPQPVQVVLRNVRLPVEHVVLTSAESGEVQARRWLALSAQRIDLAQAPLLRLKVASDPGSSQHFVLLQLHHLIADVTSLESVLNEIATILDGRHASLPTPVPYRNHVAEAQAHARRHDSEAFFRERLAGVSEATAPFGLSDVHGDGTQLVEAREELDYSVGQNVRRQAARLGATPATIFHAAWALVLARTSGRDDVVFGTVLLGRLQSTAGANRALGMFINTLPLRRRLTEASCEQLVRGTQGELAELLAHEQTSLAIAQRCGSIAGGILFSTLLNYRHSVTTKGGALAGTQGVRVLASQNRTNYPITLSVDDLGNGFALSAQTDAQLEPGRLLAFMHQAVRVLIDALESTPERMALELDVMPPAERQLLESFNATEHPYPHGSSIPVEFREQVRRAPDACAVEYGERRLAYGELNAISNRLARRLAALGVESGDLVVVLMRRSVSMVITQLATMKCGAVYMPVDPTLPTERQRLLISDSGAGIVVCDPAERGPDCVEVEHLLMWGLEDDALEEESAEDLPLCVTADSPAYVMYTSGSTGIPKGVVVPHRGVLNISSNPNLVALAPGDCIAHYSNPAFDASTLEVWGALLTGARLAVFSPEDVLDPNRFAQSLLRHGVNTLYMSVGLFNQYSELLQEVFPRLRYLMVGGDALEPGTIRRVLASCAPSSIQNVYGPTECTTISSAYQIECVMPGARSISIGRPVANARIYVLNPQQKLLPVGVPGEIYIAGAGVACGYLNRPELTAERFVRDPFSGDPSARMYRSGDIAKWNTDGTLDYLGRNDSQVKIRGFRVELGEIEARLRKDARVREVVLQTRKDSSGEKQLVAYVVPRAGDRPVTTGDLREMLRKDLPEFMIPSAFVFMEALPLSSTGKVDRQMLPEPGAEAFATRNCVAPLGVRENALAEIWRQLLRVERIGREDNFFELGGHSLLAMQLIVRVSELLGSRIRVADIYRHPTLRELAARLDGERSANRLIDLRREAILDDRICGVAVAPGPVEMSVLLTGATGFVGRFLLAELLQKTRATVYCLVRSSSDSEACDRIRGVLKKWDLWHESFAERVHALAGDLRAPTLGLSRTEYHRLAGALDSIYHCATSMNHLETYSMAQAANVDGVRRLIELAATGHPKTLHYISTLGVFSPATTPDARVVDECSPIDEERHWDSDGYGASKWVAEKLILIARERGVPANIFRLGLIWADTRHGRYDELQREYRLFKTCLICGFGIENYVFEMNPTPVDYVSRAVVHLGARHRAGGMVFHLASPSQVAGGLFERCNAVANTNLILLPWNRWIREIERLHDEGRSLPITPLIESAFHLDEQRLQEWQRGVPEGGRIEFSCQRTMSELSSAGIVAPIVDDDVLRRYIDALRTRDVDWLNVRDSRAPRYERAVR